MAFNPCGATGPTTTSAVSHRPIIAHSVPTSFLTNPASPVPSLPVGEAPPPSVACGVMVPLGLSPVPPYSAGFGLGVGVDVSLDDG